VIEDPPSLTEEDRAMATMLAMAIRNALEGTLHGGAELVRRADADPEPDPSQFVGHGPSCPLELPLVPTGPGLPRLPNACGPSYWEPPELLPEYVEDWPALAARDDGYAASCRHCDRQVIRSGQLSRTHLAADGTTKVSCRAASFTVEEGWDDTLKRAWRASPAG
jgi:hypothetical protein